ncbi:glycoside hydrolase family 9 protein [Mucilaginibacter lappiensis]|uniref:glycoside hydrolase family 9 protein n=1 Tax=Mucilaginibacter lappiensis TaxID=354630 RepID=UPI003D1DEFB8
MRVFSKVVFCCILIFVAALFKKAKAQDAWIRINQLGYELSGIKVGVWAGKNGAPPAEFQLIDAKTAAVVFTGNTGKPFGGYGPFKQSYRLDFTKFNKPGSYHVKCGNIVSPEFRLADDIYKGTADFCLRYMRQQRSGFNPYLNDSCHTKDGFTMYGPMADGTHIYASGGWHDASDYLQYVTTSANATYHLLAAYRDFPGVFTDTHQGNGLDGNNGVPDVLDEAKWGLDWLLKMHPKKDWMFNQLADDRDHAGLRLPAKDSVDYGMGKGNGRIVYFANGKPQGLGKYKNRTTGVASTAGKFASAFALAAVLYEKTDTALARLFRNRSVSAYDLGLAKPGVCQTAPNLAPYFYEEDNWTDDMELASAALFRLTGQKKYLKQSLQYSAEEKVTPWLGADTARHYQWYPFHNFGHYELARETDTKTKAELISYYKEGIEKVWAKAKNNAFYRGIPFIWCSNNLTTSFAIQCALYRKLSGDKTYATLEQACIDWLFGCNPWGKCMIYGLPANGDTPKDPHSSLAFLYHYPLDGGLVDGPVYGSIFKNLRGLRLNKPDAYAEFQSDLVVYHDDMGDYSTNEPTMDGTASLVYLLAGKAYEERIGKKVTESRGVIIRGDTTFKKIALVFTGDEFGDGAQFIANTLKQQRIHGSFFLTGNFYRNKDFKKQITQLKLDGNYLGSHSDKHLLYCDWNNRDSLLVTRQQFDQDIKNAYQELKKFNIDEKQAHYFLPPYEWYNDTIASWTRSMNLQLVNFTPGTRSNADYTFPEMGVKYVDSDAVMKSVLDYEQKDKNGLNGFILLTHIGTDPKRKDKFYAKLPYLITALKNKGYQFVKIDELLRQDKPGTPVGY